jgi:hypothetical protein
VPIYFYKKYTLNSADTECQKREMHALYVKVHAQMLGGKVGSSTALITALSSVITLRVVVITCLLKLGPIGFPETSVRNYHYSLHNKLEDCSSHILGSGSLASLIAQHRATLCRSIAGFAVF